VGVKYFDVGELDPEAGTSSVFFIPALPEMPACDGPFSFSRRSTHPRRQRSKPQRTGRSPFTVTGSLELTQEIETKDHSQKGRLGSGKWSQAEMIGSQFALELVNAHSAQAWLLS
jgi:hypothetical protein